jgi:hypothetical protein
VQLDLRQYFPNCSHVNLLITTRNRDLITYARGTKSSDLISGLTSEDTEELLINVSKREATEVVKRQAAKIVKVC